jgi:hypothetical protein
MNNDTTQHDTTSDTTRHYIGTHTLGHHVWVAGNAYVENAKAMLALDEPYAKMLAETLLGQAENAFTWANALQAGVIGESLDDLLGVDVPVEDAWVRTSEIARAWAMFRGVTLPEPPSHVGTSGHSPENVSRETLGEALPPAPAPVGYIGLMETTNTYTAQPTAVNLDSPSDLVAQLIKVIAQQVMAQVTDEVEAIAETVAENVYDSKDISSEVTESYDFTSAVEDVISGHDFSDIVRDAVRELSFSVTVD